MAPTAPDMTSRGRARWRDRALAPCPRPGRRRGLASSAAVAVVALLCAACGGSAGATRSSTTTTAPRSSSSARSAESATRSGTFAAYASCLRSHGAAPPGSPPRPYAGASTAALAAARVACAKLRPSGGFGFGFGGAAGSPANSQLLAAYRNCLKIHGVTLPARARRAASAAVSGASSPPTTAPSPPGRRFTPTPAEKAAFAACSALLPRGTAPAASG